MFTKKIVTVQTYKFSNKEFEFYLLRFKGVIDPHQNKMRNLCIDLLKDLIYEHRHKIVGSPDGYQLIRNGYGHFTKLRTLGERGNPVKDIKAKAIIKKLIKLEER